MISRLLEGSGEAAFAKIVTAGEDLLDAVGMTREDDVTALATGNTDGPIGRWGARL